jgi:hypothetical protein
LVPVSPFNCNSSAKILLSNNAGAPKKLLYSRDNYFLEQVGVKKIIYFCYTKSGNYK